MKELINQIVVVRADKAGSWAGIVKSVDEKNGKIQLTEAHRLWRWQAKDGISLSGVANFGVAECKVCKPVKSVLLNISDCCEIMESNATAFETIKKMAKC